MGIEGAVGFLLKSSYTFGTYLRLTKQDFASLQLAPKLIIDATKALDKLVKEKGPSEYNVKHDALGSSMVALGQFYSDLIKRLRKYGIEPVIVFNGGRKSDRRYTQLASNVTFLEQTCSSALYNVNKKNTIRDLDQTELSMNALKEVLKRLGLDTHQAAYEVYPTLEHLSRKLNCPVLTGHADFIFSDTKAGFFSFNDIKFDQADTEKPMTGLLYEHSKMLSHYNLNEQHSSALKTFSVLLRPDFHRSYYDTLNALFELPDNLRMSANTRDKVQTRRLMYIVAKMSSNPKLRSYVKVRNFLGKYANASVMLTYDFDTIYDTYATHYGNFETIDFYNVLSLSSKQRNSSLTRSPPVSPTGSAYSGNGPNHLTAAQLHKAITKGESSAEFVFNLSVTHFNRTLFEDVRLFRSTFSLQDVVRQFILDNAISMATLNELVLYDRQRDSMNKRRISRLTDNFYAKRIDRESMFKLFHISQDDFEVVSQRLVSLQIDRSNSEILALLLLLTRFAFRIAFRTDYTNAVEARNLSIGGSGTSGGSASNGSYAGNDYQLAKEYKKEQEKFYIALINSYIYRARDNQGDESSRDISASIRVARNKIDERIITAKVQPEDSGFIKLKHMIEMLNSVLHIYQEFNSLYDYPAPILYVCSYYDGTLIHKILAKFSNNLKGYLLDVDDHELREKLDLNNS